MADAAELRGTGARAAGPALRLAAAAALGAAACGPDAGQETALLRGDAAFARGDYQEALAEYRLSMRSEAPGTDGTLRTAHAYLVIGRVDEARALYEQAVLDDSAHAEQAAADFAFRAAAAFANGDSYGGASAMEAALRFRPGILVDDLVMPMARHYAEAGEHGRALPLYLRVLEGGRDDPGLLFDAARAHREIGDCRGALGLLEELVELEPARTAETRWDVGDCAFRIAAELIREGAADDAALYALADGAEAAADSAGAAADSAGTAADSAHAPMYGTQEVLFHLDMVLRAGEPRARLPEAYFHKAEILARMGRCAAAAAAYDMVSDAGVAGSGARARLARERADSIRFGDAEDRC